MIIIHIIGPSSVKKIPFLLNDPHTYNRSFLSQKNSPYLLNDPHTHNRSFLSQKNSLYLLNDPMYLFYQLIEDH